MHLFYKTLKQWKKATILLWSFLVVTLCNAQVSFTVDTASGCFPLTVTFTNTSSVGNYYEWDFDDGYSHNGLDTSHTYTFSSKFYPRLNAFDTTGGGWNFLGSYEMPIDVMGVSWAGPAYSEMCPGETSSFYSSGEPDSQMWYFGDGDSSSLKYPKHKYDSAGIYNIMYVYSSVCGVDTIFSVLTVTPTATPPSNFRMSNNNSCPNDNIHFRFDGTESPDWNFVWDFGDGSPMVMGRDADHSFSSTGVFAVSLTTYNSCGNFSSTVDTVYINNPNPWGNLGLYVSESCPGDEVEFRIWGNQGPAHFQSYVWAFGDGDSSMLNDPNHAYADTGNYNVSVLITNGCGMDTTILGNAFVDDSIYPELDNGYGVANDNSNPCPGDSVLFYYAGSASTVLWDFGDGNSAYAVDTLLLEDEGRIMEVLIVKHPYDSVGTYNAVITVTNSCGLSTSDSISVNIATGSPAMADFVWTAPNPGPNYQACTEVEILGIGGVSYEWDFGDGNQDSVGVSTVYHTYMMPGIYPLSLTVTNGCGNSDTKVEMIMIDGINPVANIVHVNCNGGNNGKIDLFVSGGTPPYSFFWSNGETGSVIDNLTAGSYDVNIYDANGCYFYQSYTVFEPSPIVFNVGSTESTCLTANGSAWVDAFGGVPPYNYLWTPDSLTGDSITNLFAGMYQVEITDANGCVEFANVSVNDAGAPIIIFDSVGYNACYGDVNGWIEATVSGGTPTYDFNWSNGDSTEDISGLPAGFYTLMVTDVNGCVNNLGIDIYEPDMLDIDALQVYDVNCAGNCDGALLLDVMGGTMPYNFSWTSSDPGFVDPANGYLFGLCPGSYDGTVVDANGCSLSVADSINEPASLMLSAVVLDVTCDGALDGQIDLTISGGVAPYYVYWNTSDTTQDLVNLSGGTYYAEVYDNNGCMDSIFVTVNSPSAMVVVLDTIKDVQCAGETNGEIHVSVSGGILPYVFDWSNDGIGDFDDPEDLVGIPAGNYTLMVHDANGCQHSTVYSVSEPLPVNTFISSVNNVDCAGESTGMADLNVSGGTLPYIINWSNGDTTEDLINAPSGFYYVSISDINGCLGSDSVMINEPTYLTLSMGSAEPTCLTANGSAWANASGGVAPYSYVWSNGDSTDTITGIASGMYHVDVYDANGCMIAGDVIINDAGAPMIVVDNIDDVSCNGLSDGTISLSVSGGTPGYIYNWSNGDSIEDINGLVAGIYDLALADANGCMANISVAVNEPDELLVFLDYSTDVSCFGSCDGTAGVSVTGGSGSYTYTWNNGANTADVNGLCAGTYTCNVSDANGCTAMLSVVINEPPALVVSAVFSDVTCNGDSTGTIDLTVSGGTPPYDIIWSNGETTSNLSGLGAGNYSATITDAMGCVEILSVTLAEPAPVEVFANVTDVSCFGLCDGAASFTATGGDGNLIILFDGVNVNDTAMLCAGAYTLDAIDGNGCYVWDSVYVQEPEELLVALTAYNVTCNGLADGAITTTVDGASSYSVIWSTGDSVADISNLGPGNYDVEVINDATGCSVIESAVVTEPAALTVNISTSQSSCGNSDGSAVATASGGVAPYSYSWNTGDSVSAIAVGAGMYDVLVYDMNGCSAYDSDMVNDAGAPVLMDSVVEPLCFGGNSGEVHIFVFGGTPDYSYSWNTGDSTASLSNIGKGDYTVQVSDSNGCTSVLSVNVNEPDELIIELTPYDAICNGAEDGGILLNVSGGTPGYTFSWSDLSTNQNLTNVGAGNYTVSVEDLNGCLAADAGMINEPAPLSQPTIAQVNDSLMSSAAFSYQWNSLDNPIAGATNQAFGPSLDGYYSVTIADSNGCTATSDSLQFLYWNIEELGQVMEVKLYPVPVANWLNVQLNNAKAGNYTITLTNAIGQQVYNFNQNVQSGFTTRIDFSDLPHGVFYLSITNGKDQLTKKVIH